MKYTDWKNTPEAAALHDFGTMPPALADVMTERLQKAFEAGRGPAIKLATKLATKVAESLVEAEHHLEWTGYGDRYERECARESKLMVHIEGAIKAAVEAGVIISTKD